MPNKALEVMATADSLNAFMTSRFLLTLHLEVGALWAIPQLGRSAKINMKLIILLLIGAVPSTFAETILLAKTTDTTPAYVWTFSSEPPPKLPKWKKGKNPPLSVLEAETLAYAWTRKQRLAGYIPERPHEITLLKLPSGTDEDYYYKLNYGSDIGKITFWTVFILMDGKIIEPRESK